MNKRFILIRPAFYLLIFLLSGAGVAVAQQSDAGLVTDSRIPQLAPDSDVRIVVDISGSMKENDPNNLRQPAVRMLARMLPPGSRSGVWAFGQYVNMLVPPDTADQAWRDKAVTRSADINSVALHTNIGEALEVASDDFYQDRSFENTHFILLTDGKVDIAPDAEANRQERDRILSEVLGRIKNRGAHVHTIALSENADMSLLRRLAVATDGSFAVAEDAEALNRIFAQTLNAAAPQTEVPIRGNGFRIDEGAEEFTALIFHERQKEKDAGQLRLTLRRPDGLLMDNNVLQDNVRWVSEGPYDLITIKQPASGEWQVEGSLGDQSRVTVVSDLKMAVSPLPSFFYTGQPVSLDVAFYDGETAITDPDFLKLIDLTLALSTEDGRSGSKVLSRGGAPEDGVYSDTLSKLREPGTYALELVADGKTFERQFSRNITLRPPVSTEITVTGSADNAAYRFEVRPEHPALNPSASEVAIRVTPPDGDPESVSYRSVDYDAETGAWTVRVEEQDGKAGSYQVELRLTGEMQQGGSLNYTPAPFEARFPPPEGQQTPYQSMEPPAQENPLPESLAIKPGKQSSPASEPEGEAEPDVEQTERPSAANAQASDRSEVEASEQPESLDTPQEATEEPGGESEVSAPPSAEPEQKPEEGVPFWVWIAAAGASAVALLGGIFYALRRRKRNTESSGLNTEAEVSEPPIVEEAAGAEADTDASSEDAKEQPEQDEAVVQESDQDDGADSGPIETESDDEEDVPVLDEGGLSEGNEDIPVATDEQSETESGSTGPETLLDEDADLGVDDDTVEDWETAPAEQTGGDLTPDEPDIEAQEEAPEEPPAEKTKEVPGAAEPPVPETSEDAVPTVGDEDEDVPIVSEEEAQEIDDITESEDRERQQEFDNIPDPGEFDLSDIDDLPDIDDEDDDGSDASSESENNVDKKQ